MLQNKTASGAGPSTSTATSVKHNNPTGATRRRQQMVLPKYNFPGTDAREEVIAFYRNSGAHGLATSMKNRQELYDLRGLNIMLISLFQRLSSSLAAALHRLGYLSQVGLRKHVK